MRERTATATKPSQGTALKAVSARLPQEAVGGQLLDGSVDLDAVEQHHGVQGEAVAGLGEAAGVTAAGDRTGGRSMSSASDDEGF